MHFALPSLRSGLLRSFWGRFAASYQYKMVLPGVNLWPRRVSGPSRPSTSRSFGFPLVILHCQWKIAVCVANEMFPPFMEFWQALSLWLVYVVVYSIGYPHSEGVKVLHWTKHSSVLFLLRSDNETLHLHPESVVWFMFKLLALLITCLCLELDSRKASVISNCNPSIFWVPS